MEPKANVCCYVLRVEGVFWAEIFVMPMTACCVAREEKAAEESLGCGGGECKGQGGGGGRSNGDSKLTDACDPPSQSLTD